MAEIYCTPRIDLLPLEFRILSVLYQTMQVLNQPPDADYSLWIPTARRNPGWYVNCLLFV